MRNSTPVSLLGAFALAIFLCAWPVSVAAHDIPNDVTIQTFVKPEGTRLRVLARVPLAPLKVSTWPLKAPDLLDTRRATAELTDAAMRSLANEATLFEGEQSLPAPHVVAIRATRSIDQSFQSYEQA